MHSIKRKPNITKWLNKFTDGHWKYYPNNGWFDEQNRMVLKVKACQCDEPCPHGFRYCLYGDDIPEYIYPY